MAMAIVWIQGNWLWPTFWTAAQAVATGLAFSAALWYALIARRQTTAIVNQEALAAKDYLERNKPVVFVERDESRGVRHPEYTAHNVGGGFAMNVYFYESTLPTPILIGALATGEQRTLPAALNHRLSEGDSGLKFLIVAEAPFSRTTQWTPTMNLRTQTAGDHRGQVLHWLANVEVQPPRFCNQSLQDYMRLNREAFLKQLFLLQEV
jgi:hypothetical protein